MSNFELDKPVHLIGATDAFSDADLRWVLAQFKIGEPVDIFLFPRRGNINLHTYEVHTREGGVYLLQKINPNVFVSPRRVVDAELISIGAQKAALRDRPVEGWHPVELVESRGGEPWLDISDETGRSVWRLMVFIGDSVAYKSLSELPSVAERLSLAEETGRGLAIYSKLTSSIEAGSVAASLPGYRDTGLYYAQFKSILSGSRTLEQAAGFLPSDPVLREATERLFVLGLEPEAFQQRLADPEVQHAVQLALAHETLAMSLWRALEEHRIRKTLIHGDPKVENFLFDSKTGKVKALVDLDTIMAFTWLADYGDMIRSLVNVAGEKETDLSKIVIDRDVFEAVTRGFLRGFADVDPEERSLMATSALVMILELGVRFLTDWLRGDTYFRLNPTDPPVLNRTRALVQFRLFEEMLQFRHEAETFIAECGRSSAMMSG